MRTRLLYSATMAVLLAASGLAISQETPAQQIADVEVLQHDAPAPKHFYKLNFVLRETDEGRVINQRAFTMNIAADPPLAEKPMWWNLRSGTRVPVADPKGGTTYVDIGVNLDGRAFDARRWVAIGGHLRDLFGRDGQREHRATHSSGESAVRGHGRDRQADRSLFC